MPASAQLCDDDIVVPLRTDRVQIRTRDDLAGREFDMMAAIVHEMVACVGQLQVLLPKCYKEAHNDLDKLQGIFEKHIDRIERFLALSEPSGYSAAEFAWKEQGPSLDATVAQPWFPFREVPYFWFSAAYRNTAAGMQTQNSTSPSARSAVAMVGVTDPDG